MARLFAQLGSLPSRCRYTDIRLERPGFLSIYTFANGSGRRYELMERGNAIAVMPVDFRRRVTYLVEQVRPLMAFTTDQGHAAMTTPGGEIDVASEAATVKEFCAGMIDGAENAEAAVCRELREETGIVVTPDRLRRLCSFYNSVGGTTEQTLCYLADLPEGFTHESPSGDGEENIRVWEMTFEEVWEALDSNRLCTASAIILAQWLRQLDAERR